MVPTQLSTRTYDPERFYFVRAVLCMAVAMWGTATWIALAWLRIQLERVPRPKWA